PLTPMQKGMLFHSLLDPESGAYFEQATLTIEGNINAPKFAESIRLLSKRHAILRTNFYNGWRNTPLQIVYKDKGIEFSYKTLDKLIVNEQDQNSALQYYIEEDNRRGFDLYNDPLMRISILQVDKEKYHMIWSFHHILMDGWCAPLLFNELFTNYYSLCQNKEIIDTPITPYSQYIEWLDKQDQNKAAEYWNKYLEGYDENTSISNDLSKENEGEQYDIDEVICELGTELTNKLKFVANQEQVTVNTIIQSAWGILLQRYNNTRDVLFGTVVSGRPTDIYGIEQMIGLFINTIPVRIQSNKEYSFESLIKKIQQQAVESNNYDTYPLYEIQRETEQKQELINHIMVFENYPMDTKPEENISNEYLLKVENADVKEQTNYNFNLIVAPGNSYKIRLNYNKNAYNRTYIEKIKEHLYQILYQTIENPNILLDEIEIVNKNEKVQLLEFCQDKNFEFMHDMNIIQLFENQVRQTPDKTALLYGEESLTYLELNQHANKIAHMLKRKNIESDEVVGLMVDRSLDMIIGVLGILKVGAAYLPIDPDFPNERIEFMLNDSKSKLLLFHSHLKKEFPHHIEQLCWDNRICEIAQNDNDANLNLEITANQLAYIIYTSGTTGQPKGILTSHKNVIRVVKDTNYIAINSSDNILQLSNYAFDGSIFDIFGALLNGAQLVMITKETLLDIRKLADCLVEKKVNVLFITTALFNVLIDYSLDSLINIRKVLFGGERASHLHVKKALKYLSADKIIHVYGPTESTVFATYYEVNELDEDVTNIPIGKPLGYTKAYILNDSCQLQPIGIAGELCIGGSGLAKGYLNRLDLTEDKFITDPFNDGEKIYKTGDLARWLPDGNIEYFGRIDHQVKIRGYRIEIGEIEAQLLKMDSIHEVIVIVKEEQPGLKKLYAYWVGDSTLETNSIRNHLTKSLPEYMIPSYFIRLEHLPLTLNGKVNTKLLPSLSLSESRENDFVAPQTKNEKLLAEIWCNVLGLDSVSTSDNFFEIGGDSIKTIQITAKLAQLGYELEMKHWFKHQTLRQLSKNIKQNAVMVEQREVYGEVPLTPIQRWFISQNYDEPHYFNQSMMLFSQELYKEDTICTTMNHILAHHDYLRTVLKQSNESIKAWNRKISSENLYSLTVYDLDDCIDLPGTIERLANQTQGALNLNHGPLINVAIFKTSSGDHLLISVHHFIIDMVSWRILLEDFSTVYKQVRNHKEIKLPNKTSSFQDWASSLLQYAQSEKLIEEKKYWNKIFERNYNQLPKDFKENKGTVTTSETVTVSLSSKDTKALLKNSHQTYNTEINDLLLVALGMSVKKWANINDIIINLEGHGREQLFNHLNITRTVGWFTTQYPVVLNMEESSNLEKTIQQTRDMLREIPNKGIGYGILKYLSSATEDFKNHYIPEISFNYLGQFDQDLQNNTNYLSDYSKGSDVSLKQSRTNSLDIYGMAINGKLSLTINYSNLQYRKKTIMSLVKLLEDNLKQVIHHCSTKNTEALMSYSNTTPVLNNIEEFSNKLFDENYILDVPGISMVVVKDGKVVFSKGYGYSDVISQTPMNSTSSLMRVGSITKLMTSSITLQLEKEGKLSLSQDISNYLEDLSIPRTINSSLTIEHLLNYSSGFDIQNKGMNQLFDINGTLSLKEFIELNRPSVIKEPGKSYQYESFGFLLLGYLIEKIEGISFGDYISERLLKPLEMNSSNLVSNLLIEKRLASGYDLENKYVGMYSYSSLDSSSGGMISTGSDLAKFMMMLLQNGMYKGKQILSETVTKKMLALKEENKLGRSYGQYGFELNFHPSYMDLPIFSKSGNIHGYSSFTWLMPKENLGVLVLSNKSIMNKIEIFEQFMDTYYPHYKNTPSVSLI
ncbi:amino acid adenylation domain-containing protein, partial [Paenibacillus sp. EKM208P]